MERRGRQNSTDDVNWHAAGSQVPLEIAGGWIGVFVASNAGMGLVKATFDHLQGLRPTQMVVLGGRRVRWPRGAGGTGRRRRPP